MDSKFYTYLAHSPHFEAEGLVTTVDEHAWAFRLEWRFILQACDESASRPLALLLALLVASVESGKLRTTNC
jgi:hypothetical protein